MVLQSACWWYSHLPLCTVFAPIKSTLSSFDLVRALVAACTCTHVSSRHGATKARCSRLRHVRRIGSRLPVGAQPRRTGAVQLKPVFLRESWFRNTSWLLCTVSLSYTVLPWQSHRFGFRPVDGGPAVPAALHACNRATICSRLEHGCAIGLTERTRCICR